MKTVPDLTPDEIAQLPGDEVSANLSLLSLKLSQARLKLSSTSLKFTEDLCDADDCGLSSLLDFKEKVCDSLFRFASRTGCRLTLSQLKDQRDEIVHLFTIYRPVMVRGNRLLASRGIVGVKLNRLRLNELPAAKDIEEEFNAIYEQTDRFLEKTQEAADQLSDLLDQHEAELKQPTP